MANEFDIKIKATGADQAANEIKKIPKASSSAARAIGNSSKQTGRAIKDIQKPTREAEGALIGFERKGSASLGKLTTNFGKVSNVAVKVKGRIDDIGRANGFTQAEAKAKRYWQSVDAAAKKTENLQRSMEKTRNFGAGMAAAGGAGVMVASRFIQGAKEDTAGTARFEAMMNKRGQGGELPQMSKWIKDIAYESAQMDDDPIKQASTALLTFGLSAKQVQQWMPGIIGQARVLEQDLVSVAEQAGKAFAKGDIGALTRAGVTIDPADVERMKSINDHAEKQAMLFDLVKKSFEQYALSMTEGMSEAEIASNRATLAMDDMNTAIGTGALKAENQVKSLGVSIAGLILPSQDAGEAAGYIGTIGSYAAAATGGVLGLTSQVGLTMLAFPKLGTVAGTVLDAIKAKAITTGAAVRGISGLLIPGAAAIGGALYLKSLYDDRAAGEDMRAGGVDTAGTAGRNRAALLDQAEKNRAAQAEIGERIKERKSTLAKSYPFNILEGKTPGAIKNEISSLEAELKSLQMTEASLRKRAASAPVAIPSRPVQVGGAAMAPALSTVASAVAAGGIPGATTARVMPSVPAVLSAVAQRETQSEPQPRRAPGFNLAALTSQHGATGLVGGLLGNLQNMGAGMQPFGTGNMPPLAGIGSRRSTEALSAASGSGQRSPLTVDINPQLNASPAEFIRNGAAIRVRLKSAQTDIIIPNVHALAARSIY